MLCRSMIRVMALSILSVSMLAVGCNNAAPPTPKKASGGGAAQQTTGAATAGTAGDTGTATTTTGGGVTLETALAIQRKDATALSFPVGQPLAIAFQLVGDAGKDVIVGLSESPAGPTLTRDGSNVTFNWVSPVAGTQAIRFVLRDRAKCQAAIATPADCDIKAADAGHVTVQAQYDVQSEEFSLQIGAGAATGGATGSQTTGGTSTGLATTGGASGSSGGNSALITQIMSLLGSNGGGNVQNLLGGLSGGQLQQVLSMVQGGGGGNISQIISLVQNLGLRDAGGNGAVPPPASAGGSGSGT